MKPEPFLYARPKRCLLYYRCTVCVHLVIINWELTHFSLFTNTLLEQDYRSIVAACMHIAFMSKREETIIFCNKRIENGKEWHNPKAICGGKPVLDTRAQTAHYHRLFVYFHQMRTFHLDKGDGEISFGIYAASPVDHSFTAQFSEMEMGECKWEAWSAEDTGFEQTSK